MRNTTVLPPRSTPVASANTLGSALEHEAHHPEAGPHLLHPPAGVHHRPPPPGPGWARRRSTSAAPSTMSVRIFSDSTRRVVLRPRARAAATSASLASSTGRMAVVVLQPAGEAVEEGGHGVVGHGAHPGEGRRGPVDGLRRPGPLGGGHVEQVAGGLHHHQAVAGAEGLGQGRRHGGDPVAADHDRHPRLEAGELAHGSPSRPVGRVDVSGGWSHGPGAGSTGPPGRCSYTPPAREVGRRGCTRSTGSSVSRHAVPPCRPSCVAGWPRSSPWPTSWCSTPSSWPAPPTSPGRSCPSGRWPPPRRWWRR